METIFVNFRNGDEATTSGFVADHLARRFGKDAVFRSSDSIPPGADYAVALEAAARDCTVLLALIGPRWLTVTDSRGRPRLMDERDWVRREIAAALDAGRIVIPVLVAETKKLRPEALPAEIRAIAQHQYVRLRPRDLVKDMEVLCESVRAAVPRLPMRSDRPCGIEADVRVHNVRASKVQGAVNEGEPAPMRVTLHAGDVEGGAEIVAATQRTAPRSADPSPAQVAPRSDPRPDPGRHQESGSRPDAASSRDPGPPGKQAVLRHGGPAAVSVVLGAAVGILTNLVTSGGPTLALIAGLVACVLCWGAWEGWRTVRAATPPVKDKIEMRGEAETDYVSRTGSVTGAKLIGPLKPGHYSGVVQVKGVDGKVEGLHFRSGSGPSTPLPDPDVPP